jgi:hypothetical protein
MIHLATELAVAADKPATVGQLLTTALITGVVSVAGSLLLARSLPVCTQEGAGRRADQHHEGQSAELDQQLTNKKAELEQSLRNELAADHHKRVMDRQERVQTVLAESAGLLLVAVEDWPGSATSSTRRDTYNSPQI